MTPRLSRRKQVDHSSCGLHCAVAVLVALGDVLANQFRIQEFMLSSFQQEGERPVVTTWQLTRSGGREDAKLEGNRLRAVKARS